MTRLLLGKLEFYITNVCNLTCGGCNRYNNYNFKGAQNWNDYSENLAKWAEKIEINHLIILGGEPLLNATINQWVTGLRSLWPRRGAVQIQSNGTRIDQVPGLYEALDHGKNGWIGVSAHSPDDLEELTRRIRRFLRGTITETADPNHITGSKYQFVDSQNTKVNIWMNDHFVQSNIIEQPDGRFGLYKSNPEVAHANCTFVKFKNYHWIRGKIYKCGPAALMPEFDKQHNFDISDEDRILLNSYDALSVEDFDQRGEEFFRTIDDVIPQCKFCPEKYTYDPITFSNRKKDWKLVAHK
jgi:organic radical activating enzyme